MDISVPESRDIFLLCDVVLGTCHIMCDMTNKLRVRKLTVMPDYCVFYCEVVRKRLIHPYIDGDNNIGFYLTYYD